MPLSRDDEQTLEENRLWMSQHRFVPANEEGAKGMNLGIEGRHFFEPAIAERDIERLENVSIAAFALGRMVARLGPLPPKQQRRLDKLRAYVAELHTEALATVSRNYAGVPEAPQTQSMDGEREREREKPFD